MNKILILYKEDAARKRLIFVLKHGSNFSFCDAMETINRLAKTHSFYDVLMLNFDDLVDYCDKTHKTNDEEWFLINAFCVLKGGADGYDNNWIRKNFAELWRIAKRYGKKGV